MHSRQTAPPLSQDTNGMPAPERLLRQFRIVLSEVKTHFQTVERTAGLGGAQVWALSVIAARPGIGVNDLAAALSIRQPTASNLVKGLVRAGLIETSRSETDRRQVQLLVLGTGKKLLARVPGPASGLMPAALQQLDSATLTRLEADLSTLIALLRPTGQAADQPLARL